MYTQSFDNGFKKGNISCKKIKTVQKKMEALIKIFAFAITMYKTFSCFCCFSSSGGRTRHVSGGIFSTMGHAPLSGGKVVAARNKEPHTVGAAQPGTDAFAASRNKGACPFV